MVKVEVHRFQYNRLLWYTDYDMGSRHDAEKFLRYEGYTRQGTLWHKVLDDGRMIAVIRR